MKKNLIYLLSGLILSITCNVNATEILVPAYFYPSSDPNLSFWDEMTAAASQVNITAIMNPNSGPSNAVNADYTAAAVSYTHLDVYKRQGLCKVDYYNLSAGVVALHKGYKT